MGQEELENLRRQLVEKYKKSSAENPPAKGGETATTEPLKEGSVGPVVEAGSTVTPKGVADTAKGPATTTESESLGTVKEGTAGESSGAEGGVPSRITRGMRRQLKGLGYNEVQVNSMTPADAWKILKPKIESGPLKAEILPGRTKVIEDYLSYADADISKEDKEQALRFNLDNPQAGKYADALLKLMEQHGREELVKIADKMQGECVSHLQEYGILPGPYTKSRSWAMWDMGKQQHFFSHQKEADKRYEIADPFSPSKQKEMIDRHIGWEAYQAYRSNNQDFIRKIGQSPKAAEIKSILDIPPKENGTLSSLDLARLGSLLAAGFSILPTPETGPIGGAREIKPTSPEAPGGHETPEKDLPTRLAEARKNYLTAQKKLDDIAGIKRLIKHISPESKQKVEEELEKAEQEYKKLRAEYVATDVERFVEEKTKLIEQRLDAHRGERSWAKKGYDWYKGLSQYNLEAGLSKLGVKVEGRYKKAILRSINVRSATSLGLLGGGILFGAGSAVGITAIAMRRVLAGTGSGVGFYDMANWARKGLSRSEIKSNIDDKEQSPEKLQELLASIESSALLDGKKIEDLQKDELYTRLLETYKKRVKEDFEATKNKEELLLSKLEEGEKVLKGKLKTEKRMRAGTAVMAAGLGTVVGSGALAKLFGRTTTLHSEVKGTAHAGVMEKAGVSTEVKVPSAHVAETPTEILKSKPLGTLAEKLTKTEILHHGKPTGASLEIINNETVLHAGRRGIEGTMMDLKEADPAKYKNMMDWLKTQYPQAKTGDSNLIHRFVADYAHKNGYGIGEGAKDLSKISSADLHVGVNGEISLDPEKLHFIPKTTEHFAAGTGQEAVSSSTAPAGEVMPIKLKPKLFPSESLRDFSETGPQLQTHPFSPNISWRDFPSMASRIEAAREIAAAAVEKTSDALHLILQDNYEAFLKKTVHISAKAANKFGKMSLSEFMEHFSSGKDKSLNTLAGQIAYIYRETGYPKGVTVRKFLIEMAKKYNK